MENGDCYPCQHCCGKEVMKDEFRKEFVRQKCVDDLMGDCSCRPIEGCNTLKKCYVNATSTTPIPLIVMTSPKHLTKKAIINLSTEVNTLNPFSAKVAFHYPSSEPSANHSIGR